MLRRRVHGIGTELPNVTFPPFVTMFREKGSKRVGSDRIPGSVEWKQRSKFIQFLLVPGTLEPFFWGVCVSYGSWLQEDSDEILTELKRCHGELGSVAAKNKKMISHLLQVTKTEFKRQQIKNQIKSLNSEVRIVNGPVYA